MDQQNNYYHPHTGKSHLNYKYQSEPNMGNIGAGDQKQGQN